jgi:hypothetical protein
LWLGESILKEWHKDPSLVLLTFSAFAAASLLPMLAVMDEAEAADGAANMETIYAALVTYALHNNNNMFLAGDEVCISTALG